MDFLIYSKLSDIVAIEVKASANPSRKDYKGLFALEEEFKLARKIIVCSAVASRKTEDGVEILTLEDFLNRLWKGQII